MDMGGGGGGEGGAGDDTMGPMPMSLLLTASCNIGPLFLRAWTIETCGQYYFSLAAIALVCFLRHFLTMYKTRLILRLPEESGGASTAGGAARMHRGVLQAACCSSSGACSYGSTTQDERRKLARAEQGGVGGGNGGTPQSRLLTEDARAKLEEPICLKTRLVLTGYFSLMGASSLMVMLLAMSFNIGILFAILVGEAAGHLFFATDTIHNLIDSGSFSH